jgi:hypothetical protein
MHSTARRVSRFLFQVDAGGRALHHWSAMIPRRHALLKITWSMLTSAWALVACSPSRLRSGKANTNLGVSRSGSKRREQLAAALEEDLTRLRQRAYSEEGIPVFLLGENLAAEPPASRPNPSEQRARITMANAFREHAEIFQALHPNATGSDVAKIVEVLAERDFGPPGQRGKPE